MSSTFLPRPTAVKNMNRNRSAPVGSSNQGEKSTGSGTGTSGVNASNPWGVALRKTKNRSVVLDKKTPKPKAPARSADNSFEIKHRRSTLRPAPKKEKQLPARKNSKQYKLKSTPFSLDNAPLFGVSLRSVNPNLKKRHSFTDASHTSGNSSDHSLSGTGGNNNSNMEHFLDLKVKGNQHLHKNSTEDTSNPQVDKTSYSYKKPLFGVRLKPVRRIQYASEKDQPTSDTNTWQIDLNPPSREKTLLGKYQPETKSFLEIKLRPVKRTPLQIQQQKPEFVELQLRHIIGAEDGGPKRAVTQAAFHIPLLKQVTTEELIARHKNRHSLGDVLQVKLSKVFPNGITQDTADPNADHNVKIELRHCNPYTNEVSQMGQAILLDLMRKQPPPNPQSKLRPASMTVNLKPVNRTPSGNAKTIPEFFNVQLKQKAHTYQEDHPEPEHDQEQDHSESDIEDYDFTDSEEQDNSDKLREIRRSASDDPNKTELLNKMKKKAKGKSHRKSLPPGLDLQDKLPSYDELEQVQQKIRDKAQRKKRTSLPNMDLEQQMPSPEELAALDNSASENNSSISNNNGNNNGNNNDEIEYHDYVLEDGEWFEEIVEDGTPKKIVKSKKLPKDHFYDDVHVKGKGLRKVVRSLAIPKDHWFEQVMLKGVPKKVLKSNDLAPDEWYEDIIDEETGKPKQVVRSKDLEDDEWYEEIVHDKTGEKEKVIKSKKLPRDEFYKDVPDESNGSKRPKRVIGSLKIPKDHWYETINLKKVPQKVLKCVGLPQGDYLENIVDQNGTPKQVIKNEDLPDEQYYEKKVVNGIPQRGALKLGGSTSPYKKGASGSSNADNDSYVEEVVDDDSYEEEVLDDDEWYEEIILDNGEKKKVIKSNKLPEGQWYEKIMGEDGKPKKVVRWADLPEGEWLEEIILDDKPKKVHRSKDLEEDEWFEEILVDDEPKRVIKSKKLPVDEWYEEIVVDGEPKKVNRSKDLDKGEWYEEIIDDGEPKKVIKSKDLPKDQWYEKITGADGKPKKVVRWGDLPKNEYYEDISVDGKPKRVHRCTDLDPDKWYEEMVVDGAPKRVVRSKSLDEDEWYDEESVDGERHLVRRRGPHREGKGERKDGAAPGSPTAKKASGSEPTKKDSSRSNGWYEDDVMVDGIPKRVKRRRPRRESRVKRSDEGPHQEPAHVDLDPVWSDVEEDLTDDESFENVVVDGKDKFLKRPKRGSNSPKAKKRELVLPGDKTKEPDCYPKQWYEEDIIDDVKHWASTSFIKPDGDLFEEELLDDDEFFEEIVMDDGTQMKGIVSKALPTDEWYEYEVKGNKKKRVRKKKPSICLPRNVDRSSPAMKARRTRNPPRRTRSSSLTDVDRMKARQEVEARKQLEKMEQRRDTYALQAKKAPPNKTLSNSQRRDLLMWYNRMKTPNKEEMKRRVAKLPPDCDITPEDVELLPWICRGKFLDLKVMNQYFLQDWQGKDEIKKETKPAEAKGDESDSSSSSSSSSESESDGE